MSDSQEGNYRRLLRQQTVLARFGELALKSDNLDEILTEACLLVGEALGTDLAKVMELHEDGETLLVRAGVGWKPGVVGEIVLKASETTSEGLALRTGEPMISPDIAAETRFAYPPYLTDNGVKAVANVVIIGGQGRRAFGVLQIDSREPRQFNAEDTNFLRSYANLLAAAVDRLRVIGEVRDAAERLRFAMQAGRLGVWELDLRSGELTASDTCKDSFGHDRDSAFPYAALHGALHPDDRDRMTAALDRSIATGAELAVEYRVVRADGANGWVQMHAQVVRAADGAALRVAGISLDISERIRTEERVRQSQRVEAVGRLTAGVAHDFNNVLQVLLSGIELAIEGVEDRPAVRADLDLALRAGQRGARLTSHLLSFSRQQVLRPLALELPPLVDELSRTLARTLGRDIAMNIAMAPDLPHVFADGAHLDSALLNLALNARDAMARGGELRIEAYATRGQVVIAVTDTGDGMSPEVLAHACEPFFSTKGGKGSGLGLSMVQGFAHQSGGELRIHSALGQGTRIEIWLPAASRPAVQAPMSLVKPSRGSGRILVVDDDADVARVTAAFLRHAGFDVTTVGGGNQAFVALGGQHRFDAMVTDYAMPGMTGADVVLQARELQPGLPALIITGYAGAEGMDSLPSDVAILRKPFQREELVSRIKALAEGPGATLRHDAERLVAH